jgi:hypothetical protein
VPHGGVVGLVGGAFGPSGPTPIVVRDRLRVSSQLSSRHAARLPRTRCLPPSIVS